MKSIALFIIGLSLSIAVWSQVPGTLSYQGILVNGSGDPLADGNHTVTFNFYTVPSAGSLVFSRGPFTVVTYKGMFTIVLGTGTPSGNTPLTVTSTDPDYIGNGQYYIELVADGTTLSPRVQLSSVPYAFTAQNVNSVNANNISTGTLSDSRLEPIVDVNELNVGSGGPFKVNPAGNIIALRGVTTNFPVSQGGAGTVLTNDGSGNLSWATVGGGSWALTGNAGTNPSTNFIGTTGTEDLVFRTNNTEKLRIYTNGRVAIGAGSPSAQLEVFNGASASTNWAVKGSSINGVTANYGIYGDATGGTNAYGVYGTASGGSNNWAGYFDGHVGIQGGLSLASGFGVAGQVLTSQGNNVAPIWTSGGGGGWGLTGNASTVDGTNFMGTTDNVPLNFKVNNQRAGRIDNSAAANTFFGYQAGNVVSGTGNTALGYQPLNSVTTGTRNTATGQQALFGNLTGWDNIAQGYRALYANTSGDANIGFGTNALLANTVGSYNIAIGTNAFSSNTAGSNGVAIGHEAMFYANSSATPFSNTNTAIGFRALKGAAPASNNTGLHNTAVGSEALLSNTTATWNTAVGTSALSANTVGEYNVGVGGNVLYTNSTGGQNIAIGYGALYANTGGNANIAIGYQAGYTQVTANANTTGTNNVFIGHNAGPSTSTQLTNTIALGNGATVNASNKIRLGNSSVTVIEGQVAFSASSDARLKTDIQNLSQGLDFIKALRPVSYKMKSEYNARTNWGFIAQDIERLVGTDNAVLTISGDEDRTLGLRYTDFIAPMTKAIQELNDQNEKMSEELQQLRKELAALRDLVQQSKSTEHAGGK